MNTRRLMARIDKLEADVKELREKCEACRAKNYQPLDYAPPPPPAEPETTTNEES